MLKGRVGFMYLLWLFGVCLFAFNAGNTIHWDQDTAMVDPYWADFWLISYSSGFTRRALLGEAIVWLFGDHVGYIAVNGLALVFVAVILVSVYAGYVRSRAKAEVAPFVLVVCGPLSMVFLEVLGDPLHLALALVLLYGFLARRVPTATNLPLAVVTGVLAVLVHEAAAFLFLPAVYAIYGFTSGTRIRWWVSLAVAVGPALAIAVFTSQQAAGTTGTALVVRNGEAIHHAMDRLPPFSALLWEALTIRVGTVEAAFATLGLLIRVAVWPLAAALVLRVWCGDRGLSRCLAFLLPQSLPLYVIAHDWGRFSIYTLLLGLVLSTMARTASIDSLPAWVRHTRPPSSALTERAAQAALVVLALYAAHPDYRFDGMTGSNLAHAVPAALLLASCGAHWRVRPRAGSPARDPP